MEKNLSPDVGTEVDEGLDILLGLYANNLIRMVDVEPFRLDQQPMEPDDLDAAPLCPPGVSPFVFSATNPITESARVNGAISTPA